MHCDHNKIWETAETRTSDEEREVLELGYEPFSTFRETHWQYEQEYVQTVYCYKRVKSCETCAAQNKELATNAVYLKDEIKKMKKAGKSAKGLI